MPFDRAELEKATRDELVDKARGLSIGRPEVLTRVELIDEILRSSEVTPTERRRARGWLGVARDLLAGVVEQGLHLPDAAALIRGDVAFAPSIPPQAPVATVTLAEIYAAQGHLDKALQMLDDVLDREPEHGVAKQLRERFAVLHEKQLAGRSSAFPPPPVAPLPSDLRSFPDGIASRASDPLAASSTSAAADVGEAPVERAVAVDEASPDDVTTAVEEAPAGPDAHGDATRPSDDALVILRTGPAQIFVYCEQRQRDSKARVRLVELEPHRLGARRQERTLTSLESVGGVRVALPTNRTVVRGVLETADEANHRALAVAVEAEIVESGAAEVKWTPRENIRADDLVKRATECFRSLANR